ncbi:hypothetical protein DPMN_075045 [Dreissena polymorpha]|uniref:Uncharacterized protein n=1 Tax=Dreissena polymorpha TaxID=45954 RepID=A0A9D3YGF9_DREPO|nr:hypothetical protein DPMN_075045 [Dreissena polymorpha]
MMFHAVQIKAVTSFGDTASCRILNTTNINDSSNQLSCTAYMLRNKDNPVKCQLQLPTKHELYMSGRGTINTNCEENYMTARKGSSDQGSVLKGVSSTSFGDTASCRILNTTNINDSSNQLSCTAYMLRNKDNPVKCQLQLPTKHELYMSGRGTINTNCEENYMTARKGSSDQGSVLKGVSSTSFGDTASCRILNTTNINDSSNQLSCTAYMLRNKDNPVKCQLQLPTKHELYMSGRGTINTNCEENYMTARKGSSDQGSVLKGVSSTSFGDTASCRILNTTNINDSSNQLSCTAYMLRNKDNPVKCQLQLPTKHELYMSGRGTINTNCEENYMTARKGSSDQGTNQLSCTAYMLRNKDNPVKCQLQLPTKHELYMSGRGTINTNCEENYMTARKGSSDQGSVLKGVSSTSFGDTASCRILNTTNINDSSNQLSCTAYMLRNKDNPVKCQLQLPTKHELYMSGRGTINTNCEENYMTARKGSSDQGTNQLSCTAYMLRNKDNPVKCQLQLPTKHELYMSGRGTINTNCEENYMTARKGSSDQGTNQLSCTAYMLRNKDNPVKCQLQLPTKHELYMSGRGTINTNCEENYMTARKGSSDQGTNQLSCTAYMLRNKDNPVKCQLQLPTKHELYMSGRGTINTNCEENYMTARKGSSDQGTNQLSCTAYMLRNKDNPVKCQLQLPTKHELYMSGRGTINTNCEENYMTARKGSSDQGTNQLSCTAYMLRNKDNPVKCQLQLPTKHELYMSGRGTINTNCEENYMTARKGSSDQGTNQLSCTAYMLRNKDNPVKCQLQLPTKHELYMSGRGTINTNCEENYMTARKGSSDQGTNQLSCTAYMLRNKDNPVKCQLQLPTKHELYMSGRGTINTNCEENYMTARKGSSDQGSVLKGVSSTSFGDTASCRILNTTNINDSSNQLSCTAYMLRNKDNPVKCQLQLPTKHELYMSGRGTINTNCEENYMTARKGSSDQGTNQLSCTAYMLRNKDNPVKCQLQLPTKHELYMSGRGTINTNCEENYMTARKGSSDQGTNQLSCTAYMLRNKDNPVKCQLQLPTKHELYMSGRGTINTNCEENYMTARV